MSRSQTEITTYDGITYDQMKVNISAGLGTRPASLCSPSSAIFGPRESVRMARPLSLYFCTHRRYSRANQQRGLTPIPEPLPLGAPNLCRPCRMSLSTAHFLQPSPKCSPYGKPSHCLPPHLTSASVFSELRHETVAGQGLVPQADGRRYIKRTAS